MANTGCRCRRRCWAATTVRSGSRPGGCPGPMRRSGSEEIGSPSRVRITGAGGVLSFTEQNKRAYISLVNSRAEALGYKTRNIARLLLPGAPNGFSSRDNPFCLHVQVSYPSSSSGPHSTASASSCTSPARRSRPMSKKQRFLRTANTLYGLQRITPRIVRKSIYSTRQRVKITAASPDALATGTEEA